MSKINDPQNATCMDEFDPSSLSVDQALETIIDAVAATPQSEKVSLTKLLNRVLAESILSPIDVPPYTNSAMDGYAINGSDLPSKGEKYFALAGIVYAGAPMEHSVPEGQCARIMTGGKMPEGTDTVVMQEHTQISGSDILIGDSHRQGQNVRQTGEDVKTNQSVLVKGKRLTAADIGLLASLGIAEAKVTKPVKVSIFSTGDELTPLGNPLKPGQIYDSNRYTLLAMLARFGADVTDYGVIKDDKNAIEKTLTEASSTADLIITTGGVSVGDADYVKEILETIGSVNFWKIAMKPGKPLAFGKIKNSFFFGLPGNPVSTMVTFYQFVLPAMKKLQGESLGSNMILPLRCVTPIRKNAGRVEYQRGIMETNTDGELVVRSTGGQGSHMLSSMVKANCFIILPMESKNIEANEIVEVQPFAGII